MYYYEHVEGQILKKPDIVCESGTTPCEYFASPFVKRWWYVNDKHTQEFDEKWVKGDIDEPPANGATWRPEEK